ERPWIHRPASGTDGGQGHREVPGRGDGDHQRPDRQGRGHGGRTPCGRHHRRARRAEGARRRRTHGDAPELRDCSSSQSVSREVTMRAAAAALVLVFLAQLLPAPAQSQEGGCRDRLPTDRTTVELRGADAATTLRLLAERYRVSLILTPDVT